MSIQNLSDLPEILQEQTQDAINILQLLEVELSSNQEDPHILRTITIIEKMLQEHLSTLQHQFNSDS